MRQKFAEVYGVPINEIKFLFDGEVVKDSDTPTTLDMEQDNMIDAKVCETQLFHCVLFGVFSHLTFHPNAVFFFRFNRLRSPCTWMR